ncbi:MAG: prolyl oligopeptidase family serine peptidase [Saprospiraceae bacterium]|nr:prolyl oligopeptidase family serine peptidase [Saprospiraceae bacterium]
MKKYFAILLCCLAQLAYGQQDGDLISQTKIKDFQELLTYIRATEGRDSVYLKPERFHYFEEVDVFGITYWSDGLRIKGFMLQPKEEGIYPCIIYNRGGSLDYGTLTHHVSSIGLGELARLASAGYVIVASQYRGNGGGEGHEEYGGADIRDVLNLIPLLTHSTTADTSRIGMFGWSRGGAMTFQTLKRTNKIKVAAVGGAGTDYLAIAKNTPFLDKYWAEWVPGYAENRTATLQQRSVIHWVDQLPRNVPMLLLQGNLDWKVKANLVLELALEFERYLIPYRLVMFDKGKHAIKEHREEVFEQLTRWFNRYLRDRESLPDVHYKRSPSN